MRVVDMLLAMPSLLLAVSVAALLGPSLTTVMIAVGVISVPVFARLLRGSMISQAHAEYVTAASPAAARPRSAGRCCDWSSRPAARCCSTAST
jgi:peptide/nickel transport system permease protein